MNKHALQLKISTFVFLTCSLFLGGSAKAQSEDAQDAILDHDLISQLHDSFVSHFEYQGTYKKSVNLGYGVGCKRRADFLVNWQSKLGDLSVDLSEEGIAEFAFDLEDSKSLVSYTGKNALCMVRGYSGEILTDKIHGEFRIIPRSETAPTTIEIKALKLSELKFTNWILFEPLLWNVRGDAPAFISHWAQKSFNSMVAWFLKSSFSERLDRLISDKVEEALKKRYEQSEQRRSAQAPDSSLRLN